MFIFDYRFSRYIHMILTIYFPKLYSPPCRVNQTNDSKCRISFIVVPKSPTAFIQSKVRKLDCHSSRG